MIVGSLSVRLYLRESRSLKDKRQVLQSIKDRIQNEFNVSIAEVDALDNRQLIVLGVAMAGREGSHVRGVLQKIVELLRRHPVAELVGHELEV
jgi:uncharacterized protein YlxP (DUF503 family)